MEIILWLCVLLTILNIVLSGVYFFIVKSIWRYIKLTYVISNAYMLVVLSQALRIPAPPSTIHSAYFLGLAVLLSAMLSGLIVSYSKVYLTKNLFKHTDKDYIE